MVWPFSKTPRKLEVPPERDHRWGLAQAEDEGRVLLVRYNQTAGQWAGHPNLPVKLGFAIPLNRPNEGGLPDPDENAELGPIEDLISREVLSATHGVHALTLTNGVMKELVFYIGPGTDVGKLHERVRSKVLSHEVQCMAVEERGWESYRGFAP